MEFKHISVLLNETIESLDIKPDGIYVDGTVGGAGHSIEIAKRLKSGRLYSFDRDPDAVKIATERLSGYPAAVIEANFCDMDKVLSERGIFGVDGIMLDLGVSSYQLDTAERGFSYHKTAPLDMRMSKSGTCAADLVNGLSADELTKIFRDYGEEKFAYKIANEIVKKRSVSPINTTTELADIIAGAVPAAARRDGHPARRVFQALRIAVNGELEILTDTLDRAFALLNAGGRLSVITFHSLVARIVKTKFREYCTGCICPPDLPICVCGRKPQGELVFRKPVTASDEELKINSRSRSAKLRTVKKL